MDRDKNIKFCMGLKSVNKEEIKQDVLYNIPLQLDDKTADILLELMSPYGNVQKIT